MTSTRGSAGGSKTISLRKKRIRKFSHLTFKRIRGLVSQLYLFIVSVVCNNRYKLQPCNMNNELLWTRQRDWGKVTRSQCKCYKVVTKWLISVWVKWAFPLQEDVSLWCSLASLKSMTKRCQMTSDGGAGSWSWQTSYWRHEANRASQSTRTRTACRQSVKYEICYNSTQRPLSHHCAF